MVYLQAMMKTIPLLTVEEHYGAFLKPQRWDTSNRPAYVPEVGTSKVVVVSSCNLQPLVALAKGKYFEGSSPCREPVGDFDPACFGPFRIVVPPRSKLLRKVSNLALWSPKSDMTLTT